MLLGASLLLVAMDFATDSILARSSDALCYLLLVAMPFATSSVLAPSSDALCY